MHLSVLQEELLDYLHPQANENFVDGTVNGGGDALAILQKTKPRGQVLGIDWTPEVVEKLRIKIRGTAEEPRLRLINDNFVHLKKIVQEENFQNIAGVVLDLGLSSWHLETLPRGFSFRQKGELDMRYHPGEKLTAKEIINYWSKEEIERILENYGEERFHRRLAEEIIRARKIRVIEKVPELVALIEKVIPRKGKIHPATKTFQALRIAVNRELENLEKVLPQALDILKPGGKLALITFQSLEDRIVKQFFRLVQDQGRGVVLTKKPVTPSFLEKKRNPRSRSAKLRVMQKLN